MQNLDPTSPLGFLMLMLNTRVDHARDDERGASAVEWIVIAAIVVGICGVIAAILTTALTGKANEVSGEIAGQ